METELDQPAAPDADSDAARGADGAADGDGESAGDDAGGAASGGGGPDDGGGGPDEDTATAAAPWWHSPWRLLVLGAALVFLGTAAGYALFGGGGRPQTNAVDIGFLQDMRSHHDQAVSMAFIYLEKPAAEQDPVLRSIAKTIIADQQFESGYMAGLLLDSGAETANQTGQAMAWMNEPVPADRMPGMAGAEELEQLQAATGPGADQLFADLMIAHHAGGIHMAEYAAADAARTDVRLLAERMARNQRGEITDLRNALTRATA